MQHTSAATASAGRALLASEPLLVTANTGGFTAAAVSEPVVTTGTSPTSVNSPLHAYTHAQTNKQHAYAMQPEGLRWPQQLAQPAGREMMTMQERQQRGPRRR